MAARPPAWERRYALKLLWTDIAVVILVVALSQLISITLFAHAHHDSPPMRSRLIFACFLVMVWLVTLAVNDTRNPAVFGTGPGEYKGVIDSTVLAFGVVAIVTLVFAPDPHRRDSLIVALPLGLFMLLLGRWAWRKRLHAQRRRQRNTYRTLIVGAAEHSIHMARQLRSNPLAGFELAGAVTDGVVGDELMPGLPVVAGYDDLLVAIDRHRIDTLIVTGSTRLTPARVRSIGWELEGRNVDLIVASSLTDIAGPRIHVRPVSGLPLIHVESPEFTGWRYYAKRCFDLALSLIALVPAALIIAVLAVIIRCDSRGPVLYRQIRLGLDGEPFTMYKLRSMHVDAAERLPTLLDQSDGNDVLFKMRQDPRVTRVGAFIRRHSLDELPQLINVLRGDMSLVGPRPPLPTEVERYTGWTTRRMLVRPGISGLWQVSGRSDLSWDESVRLDLFYVENWSITGDLLILWRTIRTVLRPQGAY
ncbi:sugar transferase [Leucobacter zeae]|nr:sugar transferase [Leucobacter zeae]